MALDNPPNERHSIMAVCGHTLDTLALDYKFRVLNENGNHYISWFGTGSMYC